MKSSPHLARLAGLCYLALIIAGLFGMVYVPAVTFNWEDSAQTLIKLEDNALLFRLGITGCLISFASFIAMSVVLYRLFGGVAKTRALLLLVFGSAGAALFTANAFNYVEIAALVSAGSHEALGEQVHHLAAHFNENFLFIQSFTGVWLVLFGFLAYSQRLLPALLCGLLVYSGLVNYIGGYLAVFVFETQVPTLLTLPGTLGEFGTCLWLLILGARWQARKATRSLPLKTAAA